MAKPLGENEKNAAHGNAVSGVGVTGIYGGSSVYISAPSNEWSLLTNVESAAVIYVSSTVTGPVVYEAVAELATAIGFNIDMYGSPEYGSWFARLRLRARSVETTSKLRDVANKLERAAELHYIQEPRSKSDEREANAVANLIKALESTDEAVIYLSSILFVKINGSVTAHVLSEKQILQLAEQPDLLRNPLTLHEQLAIASRSNPHALGVGNATAPGGEQLT